MKSPLEIISNLGIPTHSYVAAGKYVTDPNSEVYHLSKKAQEELISEIIGFEQPVHFSDEKDTLYHFRYTIQEVVRAYQYSNTIPDMENVWQTIQQKVKSLFDRSPWILRKFDSEEINNTNRVNKQEQANELFKQLNDGKHTRKDIIQSFIKNLDTSSAGAATLFYNCKKKFGFNSPLKQPKKKNKSKQTTPTKPRKIGPTKMQLAEEVYLSMLEKPKNTVLQEIVKQANTTLAGANTYYCKLKHKYNNST